MASVWLATGCERPVAAGHFDAGLSQHYKLNRPYLPWLIQHPLDMALFAGLPLMGFAAWRARPAPPAARARHTPTCDRRGGANPGDRRARRFRRGETGRVWLFSRRSGC